MRISDWSSDVCSSDLGPDPGEEAAILQGRQFPRAARPAARACQWRLPRPPQGPPRRLDRDSSHNRYPRRRSPRQRPAHPCSTPERQWRLTMSDARSSADNSFGRRRAMLRTAMGPGIAAALSDPAVIEIMVNPDGVLRLDRLGAGRIDTGTTYSQAQYQKTGQHRGG